MHCGFICILCTFINIICILFCWLFAVVLPVCILQNVALVSHVDVVVVAVVSLLSVFVVCYDLIVVLAMPRLECFAFTFILHFCRPLKPWL